MLSLLRSLLTPTLDHFKLEVTMALPFLIAVIAACIIVGHPALEVGAMLSPEIISEILDSDGPYANEEERATCKQLVSALTLEEQELAAQTSYTYWLAVTNSNSNETCEATESCSAEDARSRMAMREARRHLVAQGGNYDRALSSIQDTCKFRKEYQLNLLRTCFSQGDSESEPVLSHFRKLVEEDLGNQNMVVRGHNQDFSAVLIKMDRTSKDCSKDAYEAANFYILERALASTEVLSKGSSEQIITVYDFGSYKRAYAPPIPVLRGTIQLMQKIYPNRVKVIIILDAPRWMTFLHKIINPFLAPATRKKVRMVTGDAAKEKIFSSYGVDVENATPFMRPNGKLTSEVDMNKFLKEVPFHSLYDE